MRKLRNNVYLSFINVEIRGRRNVILFFRCRFIVVIGLVFLVEVCIRGI